MNRACEYNRAWIGNCGEPTKIGNRCEKHVDIKCCSCGAPAVKECEETGQFVCGAPLCTDCEHTIFADGTNGGIGFNAISPPEGMNSHCKRDEQQYDPWHARGLENSA